MTNNHWLMQKSQIVAEPLQSKTPLIGPLIAKLRNLWGSVAAKWMIHQIVRQQNEVNRLLVNYLQTLDGRLIEQDHDLVALTRQVAEMNLNLRQLQTQLQQVETRLQKLEDAN